MKSAEHAEVGFASLERFFCAQALPKVDILLGDYFFRQSPAVVVGEKLVLEYDGECRVPERVPVETRNVLDARTLLRPWKPNHRANPLAILMHVPDIPRNQMHGLREKFFVDERRKQGRTRPQDADEGLYLIRFGRWSGLDGIGLDRRVWLLCGHCRARVAGGIVHGLRYLLFRHAVNGRLTLGRRFGLMPEVGRSTRLFVGLIILEGWYVFVGKLARTLEPASNFSVPDCSLDEFIVFRNLHLFFCCQSVVRIVVRPVVRPEIRPEIRPGPGGSVDRGGGSG